MLDEVFDGLGLKEEEVKIYLGLLEFGPITVGKLAKEIGIPRPSMYGYMDRLIEMGLVSEDESGTVKLFVAENMDRLNILYMKRISELRSRQKILQQILPDLTAKSVKHYIKPKFEHFKGTDAFLGICERLLNRGIKKVDVYGIMPTEAFLKDFNAMRVRAGVEMRSLLFLPQIFDLMGVVESCEIKSMDGDDIPAFSYLILGNSVVCVATGNHFSGYVIDHHETVELYKRQYDSIWGKSCIYEPV